MRKRLDFVSIATGLLVIPCFAFHLHAQPNGWSLLEGRLAVLRPVTVYAQRLECGLLFLSEDPNHPALQALRQREHLDQVVFHETTDFGRVFALARWTRKQFPSTSPFPHYPPWNATVILDAIRHHQTGGFCAQYAIVFGQSCQSLGYTVRYVDLATKDLQASHFLTEVYMPSLKRWVAFDVAQGLYYVDAIGRPLSVLDLHNALAKRFPGKVYQMPGHRSPDSNSLALYYHFRYYLRNNFISVPVLARVVSTPQGKHLIFETYRLRWVDDLTRQVAESGTSYRSSNPHDFEFDFNTSQPVGLKQGWMDFYGFAETGHRNQVYRLALTQGTLANFVRQKNEAYVDYRPLDWALPAPTHPTLAMTTPQ